MIGKSRVESLRHTEHLGIERRLSDRFRMVGVKSVGCRGKCSARGRCRSRRGKKKETLSITLQLSVCSERESIPEGRE